MFARDNELMKKWISIEGNINGKYQVKMVVAGTEATALSEADAQQVTRNASDEYREYLWRSVRVPGSQRYIVEGERKRKK